MVSKFRIFHTPIMARSELVKSIIKSPAVLHNYIKKTKNLSSASLFSKEEERIQEVIDNSIFNDMNQLGSNHPSNNALILKDTLKNYLVQPSSYSNNEGKFLHFSIKLKMQQSLKHFPFRFSALKETFIIRIFEVILKSLTPNLRKKH